MGHIGSEGKTYCDWRFAIDGCEGSKVFTIAYLYSSVAIAVAFFALLGCLFIRKFLNSMKWRDFFKGDTSLLLHLLVAFAAILLHAIAVLLHAPPLATGILWTFMEPAKQFTGTSFFEILLEALPDSILVSENSRWSISSPQTRTKVLYFFAFLILFAHVGTISTASYLSSENESPLGRRLEVAGLVITAFGIITLNLCVILSIISIKMKIREAKRMTGGFQTQIDSTLLRLTSMKLNFSMTGNVLCTSLSAIYFFLLAFYPDFFTNLPFSKAMLIILTSISSTAMFCGLVFFYIDIKRWLYKEQVKHHSSRGSREEGEIKERTQGARPLSLMDREQVELIVTELRPKDPQSL